MKAKEILDFYKSKEKMAHVKKLKKERKYDEIYNIYGKDIYRLFSPISHDTKDIKKLLKENKYEDIFQKYGAKRYKIYLPKMYEQDIYLETGSKLKSKLHKFKYKLIKKFIPFLATFTIATTSTVSVVLTTSFSNDIKENEATYAVEIDEYNDRINEYAKSIKKLNLNDVETITKVIYDMWNQIDGYGSPEKTF